jgi:hypothetical protein
MAKDYSILPNTEKRKLMDVLKYMFHQGVDSLNKTDKEEITPDVIAASASVELVQGYVKTLFPEKATKILEQWQKELGYSSKKVLTAKQMRKQQFRYGYGEKLGVAAREGKNKKSGKVAASKFDFKETKVLFQPYVLKYSEGFDFAGDEIIFFAASGPKLATTDRGTEAANNWGDAPVAVKTLNEKDALFVPTAFNSNYKIPMQALTEYSQTRGGRPNYSNHHVRIVRDPQNPDRLVFWDANAVYSSDGHQDTPLFGTPAANARALDFNPHTDLLVSYARGSFIQYRGDRNKGNLEATAELQAPGLVIHSGSSTLISLGEDIAVVTINDGLMAGVSFKMHSSFYFGASGVKAMTISPDRKVLAIVYDASVELYNVEDLVRSIQGQDLKAVISLGAPAQVLTPSDVVTPLIGARFSEDSKKIVVANEGQFFIFETGK